MDDKTAIRKIHRITAASLLVLTFCCVGKIPAVAMQAPAWMAEARKGGRCLSNADYSNAIHHYEQALAAASKANESDPELLADLQMQIAASYCFQHDFPKAKRLLSAVHDDLVTGKLIDRPIMCRYWRRMINLADEQGRLQDSMFAKKQLVAILGKRFGTSSPEYISCLHSMLGTAYAAQDWATYVDCAKKRDEYNRSRPGATMNRVCKQWNSEFKRESESALQLAWDARDAKSCEQILQCATSIDDDPHYLIHMRSLTVKPPPPGLEKLCIESAEIIRNTYFKLQGNHTAADQKAYVDCLFGLFFDRWPKGLLDSKSISIGYEFLKTHSNDKQGGAAIPYIQVTGILALMLATNNKLAEAETVLREHRIAPKQLTEGCLLNGPVQARTELAARYRAAGKPAEAQRQFDELVALMNEQNISEKEKPQLLHAWRKNVLMEK